MSTRSLPAKAKPRAEVLPWVHAPSDGDGVRLRSYVVRSRRVLCYDFGLWQVWHCALVKFWCVAAGKGLTPVAPWHCRQFSRPVRSCEMAGAGFAVAAVGAAGAAVAALVGTAVAAGGCGVAVGALPPQAASVRTISSATASRTMVRVRISLGISFPISSIRSCPIQPVSRDRCHVLARAFLRVRLRCLTTICLIQ